MPSPMPTPPPQLCGLQNDLAGQRQSLKFNNGLTIYHISWILFPPGSVPWFMINLQFYGTTAIAYRPLSLSGIVLPTTSAFEHLPLSSLSILYHPCTVTYHLALLFDHVSSIVRPRSPNIWHLLLSPILSRTSPYLPASLFCELSSISCYITCPALAHAHLPMDLKI